MTTLHPDSNRSPLENKLARQLLTGKIPDSLSKIELNEGETPRILLIIPPYTRIKRSLDVILENLKREENSREQLEQDYRIYTALKSVGIENILEQKRAGVPMGLLRVGTATRKAGYEVSLLDGVYQEWSQEEHYFTTKNGSEMWRYGLNNFQLTEKINNFKPHLVGISIDYTHQWGNARELADLIKCVNQDIVVVMGGAHAHALPEDVLLDSPTDYVVIRQGDLTFPELVGVLSERIGKNIEEVQGIVYRREGKIKFTSKRSFISSLDGIEIPDLSLIDLSLYSGKYHSAGKRKRSHGILLYGFTTFGCNTNCTFCTIPRVQGRWIRMQEESLDKYLQSIVRAGVNEFILEDDNFLHDPEWALTVCKKLSHYDLPWVEEGGLSLYNLIALMPEVKEEQVLASAINSKMFSKVLEAKKRGITAENLIEEMRRSGCYSVYLAVESPHSKSLSVSHKPILNAEGELTKKIIALFHSRGIKVTCGLMYGFIEGDYVESRSQILQTLCYGKELIQQGASYANFFAVTPLPGAPNFNSLIPFATHNTDEGYTHEFGTMNAPNGEWTRDELTLLRAYGIINSVGMDKFKEMQQIGTWPI